MGDFVWFIPTVLLLVLLCLLYKRVVYYLFPCFFSYVAFGVVADMARFCVRNHPFIYAWTYWITETGYNVLGILVMYELIQTVLRNLAHAWWHRLIFPATLLVGILLSIARAHAVPSSFGRGLAFYVIVGEIGVKCVEALAAPLALIPLVGVPGKRYPLGIATGFGLYSLVALLVTARFSDLGAKFSFVWSVVSLVAYSAAVIVWIWAFAGPQTGRSLQARPELGSEQDRLPPAGNLVGNSLRSRAFSRRVTHRPLQSLFVGLL